MPTVAAVLATAVSQIGTVESPAGSNRQKYGAAMGLNGEPWCAIFQWWNFKQNGVDLDEFFSIPSWEQSYCPDLLNAFRGANLGHLWPDVRPGDVVFYSWDGGSLAEHVGIVESVDLAGGTVTAIEGNTAVGNDSNGGQVMRRVRDHRYIIGLGRYPFTVSLQPSGDVDMRVVLDAATGREYLAGVGVAFWLATTAAVTDWLAACGQSAAQKVAHASLAGFAHTNTAEPKGWA